MAKKFTDEQIEKVINNIKGSFHLEGQELDEFDMTLLRRYAKGEVSEEEALALIRQKLIDDGCINGRRFVLLSRKDE